MGCGGDNCCVTPEQKGLASGDNTKKPVQQPGLVWRVPPGAAVLSLIVPGNVYNSSSSNRGQLSRLFLSQEGLGPSVKFAQSPDRHLPADLALIPTFQLQRVLRWELRCGGELTASSLEAQLFINHFGLKNVYTLVPINKHEN